VKRKKKKKYEVVFVMLEMLEINISGNITSQGGWSNP